MDHEAEDDQVKCSILEVCCLSQPPQELDALGWGVG
jgi:hypothetical protein